jgi:tetratricopeptide (TPR) repeat protein
MRFAKMIGRREFDDAIAYLRNGLKGDKSDIYSLEMIADCHHWAGRTDDAINACREALKFSSSSFDMHALLAELLAGKNEHDDAAIHARKGLECYPEPIPQMPRFMISAFKALSRIVPRLRNANPDAALREVANARAEWFDWAKRYLDWYDSTHGGSASPTEH